MYLRTAIVAALICGFFHLAVNGQQELPRETKERLDRALGEIEERLKTWGTPAGPGCAFKAAVNGNVLATRVHGSADLEHNVPITPDTVFNAASIAKQFTAAAVLMLAEEKKLGLGDDIRKYLPELTDPGSVITVRHLLQHTNGLREWGDIEQIAGRAMNFGFYDNAAVLRIAARQRGLNHLPGERWSYNNTAYILLATIVERASGARFSEFTHERIFKPLGMNSTTWKNDPRQVIKNSAHGYLRSSDKAAAVPFVRGLYDGTSAVGAGGLMTTVGDLIIWTNALSSKRLGNFVAAEMERKTVLNDGRVINYGGGLDILTIQGLERIGHGGAFAGFRSYSERFPRSGLSVAVLCNTNEADARLISTKLAEALEAPADPPKKGQDVHIALKPELLATRAGLFIIEQTGFPVTITTENGRLVVDGQAMDTISENLFRSPTVWGEIEFETPDRATRRDILVFPDGLQTLRRAVPPASADLAGYAAIYWSDEADGGYQVAVENDVVTLKNVDHKGRTTGRMFPVSALAKDMFRAPGVIITFVRDDKGRVIAFDLTTDRVRALRFVLRNEK